MSCKIKRLQKYLVILSDISVACPVATVDKLPLTLGAIEYLYFIEDNAKIAAV
jgi:hypothetical protein